MSIDPTGAHYERMASRWPTFDRAKIANALDALGLVPEHVMAIRINRREMVVDLDDGNFAWIDGYRLTGEMVATPKAPDADRIADALEDR